MSEDLAQLEAAEAALKERQIALMRSELESIKGDPLRYFVPQPKQLPFFQAASCKRRGVFSGNRFGKSTIGTIEDISWMLGERVFFAPDSPLRTLGIPQTKGVKGLILCQDWSKVEEVFTNQDPSNLGKFWEWLPQRYWSKVQVHRNRQNGIIDRIALTVPYRGMPRYSSIAFDTVSSFKNNPLGAESVAWDFLHIDEPVPIEMWQAHSRGLIDSGGSAWFLLTPLEEPWIYNNFSDNEDGKTYWMIRGSMRDNAILSEEAIALYLEGLTEEEKACRLDGIPRDFGKLVYWGYVDDDPNSKHCQFVELPKGWESPHRPPDDWTIRVAIDPHPQTPHAVLFAATSPLGQTFLWAELFFRGKIKDLCKQIQSLTEGLNVVDYLCDPIAWNENQVTGEIWADEFYDLGIPIIKASKQKAEGIIRTRDLLRERPPQLFILDHMFYWKRECRGYVFDKENKPRDKDDHFMENMYRLVINGLDYVSPSAAVPPIEEKPLDAYDFTTYLGDDEHVAKELNS